MGDQPTIELNEATGTVLINGMDVGKVADVMVHEHNAQQDLLRVTLTLLPSKLTLTTGQGPRVADSRR